MPKNPRIIKLGILLVAPFSVLAGLGAYAGTGWYFFSQTKIVAASNAPSRQFRALIIDQFDSHGCGSRKSTFIVIERMIGVVKTGEFTAFCLADDGGNVHLNWTGQNELTISCLNCPPDAYEMYGPRWGKATFRYELGAGRP